MVSLEALDRRLTEPSPEDPVIDEPLPHQLPVDASFADILEAFTRQDVMHSAVAQVKAP